MTETESLDKYICQHIEPEGDYLYRLYRATNIHTIHGRMASGHIQGRLLKMLVEMIRPKNILEVGTFSGYSAICLAEGLQKGGKLYTFEINDEMEDFIRKYLSRSPHQAKVRLHIGDAMEIIPQLDETFDMVFIDADKRLYSAYYDLIFPKVRVGGLILADNTLCDGKVIEEVAPADKQTQGILHFNDKIKADDRVEKVILPMRDGLTLIWKK